jgi:C4-dicarboxylate transporter
VAVAAVVLGAFGGFVNPVDTGGIAIERTYASLELPMYSIPFTHLGPAILALVVANVTFATMTRKENRSPESVVPPIEAPRTENRRLQSVIPVLPFILFFPLEFFAWRRNWESNVDTHLAICLIVASVAAALTVIRNSSQGVKKIPSVGKVFFSGMWRGFFEVVLLIVAAKLFISPLRDIIVLFGKQALNAAPILTVASVPTAFLASALIGSGDALALALIPTVLTLVVQNATIYPGVVASMLWLATEMGRNVSPISAATLVSASAVTSTQIEGTTISSYVWRPLLVGFVVGCLALYLVFKWQHLASS